MTTHSTEHQHGVLDTVLVLPLLRTIGHRVRESGIFRPNTTFGTALQAVDRTGTTTAEHHFFLWIADGVSTSVSYCLLTCLLTAQQDGVVIQLAFGENWTVMCSPRFDRSFPDDYVLTLGVVRENCTWPGRVSFLATFRYKSTQYPSLQFSRLRKSAERLISILLALCLARKR